MELTVLITLIILISLITCAVFLLSRKKGRDLLQDANLELLKNELKEIRQEMKGTREKNMEFLQIQSGQTNKLIQEITSKLEQVGATNKQIVSFATQLQSLENILKNPKQRGILGEYFLESLLTSVLSPNQYKMQYHFKNGDTVDAVVFIRDKIVPVDAKFSLEKYNQIMEEKDGTRREQLEREFKRNVKERIDETSKYIRPSENTTDFAFMFIPAEGIFYNLLIYKVGSTNVSSGDLVEYAFSKKVAIVSPTSFFAYLQTVIQGLRALKVEESVKEIIKRVGELDRHMLNYESYLQKLGNSLGTTVNAYNTAYKEFGKIDKDVARITGGEKQIEPLQLDKPSI